MHTFTPTFCEVDQGAQYPGGVRCSVVGLSFGGNIMTTPPLSRLHLRLAHRVPVVLYIWFFCFRHEAPERFLCRIDIAAVVLEARIDRRHRTEYMRTPVLGLPHVPTSLTSLSHDVLPITETATDSRLILRDFRMNVGGATTMPSFDICCTDGPRWSAGDMTPMHCLLRRQR